MIFDLEALGALLVLASALVSCVQLGEWWANDRALRRSRGHAVPGKDVPWDWAKQGDASVCCNKDQALYVPPALRGAG